MNISSRNKYLASLGVVGAIAAIALFNVNNNSVNEVGFGTNLASTNNE